MSNAQSDTIGLLIVLALLLLFLNKQVRSIWPALFTHHTVRTNFNPLSGVSLSGPGGLSLTTPQPTGVTA